MFHVDEEFRRKVVTIAESYIGAPFHRYEAPTNTNSRTFETGTTPDPGFDCAGLVIRSICRAMNREPSDIWLDKYRIPQTMTEGIYGTANPPRLEPEKVELGDVIGWVKDEREVGHIALATEVEDSESIHYVHATHEGIYPNHGTVRRGIVRRNNRYRPIHLPLQSLTSCALRLYNS